MENLNGVFVISPYCLLCALQKQRKIDADNEQTLLTKMMKNEDKGWGPQTTRITNNKNEKEERWQTRQATNKKDDKQVIWRTKITNKDNKQK